MRNDGGTGWLLIGRGRNGWQFDTDGQGGVAGDGVGALNGTGLGTTTVFSPAFYSDSIINILIGNSNSDMTGVEVRLRRASNVNGTNFQEGRWNNWVPTTWTGDLDQGTNLGNLRVDWQILNGELGGTFFSANSGTRDGLSGGSPTPANNGQRVFTWAWGGHGDQKGFSYGQSVQGVDNNNANTFLWENGTEAHAIPYTEVYIHLLNPVVPIPEPGSAVLLGLSGLALMLGRRRR